MNAQYSTNATGCVNNPSHTPQSTTDSGLERYGWVGQPNTRGTMDIIWGSVLALFVCVWVVLHLNVPSTTDGYWTILWRKARWSVMAIVAPEVLNCFAGTQWEAAKNSVNEMRAEGYTDWTLEHAFYANSGGFILQPRDSTPFPINSRSVLYLLRRGYIKKPLLSQRDILDRSKAGHFAKFIASIQASWLVIQNLARGIRRMHRALLELFTLSFVVCTFCTFFFWFHKPLDVQTSTVLEMEGTSTAELLIQAGDAARAPFVDTPLDFIEKPVIPWERHPFFSHFGGLRQRPLPRIPNDSMLKMLNSQRRCSTRLAISTWLVAFFYCGVHLSAWDYDFPTPAERTLWRTCSLVLVANMVAMGALSLLTAYLENTFRINLFGIWVQPARKDTIWHELLFTIMYGINWTLYICARMGIIVEAVISLRSLPKGAFETIPWTSFLPHF